MVTFTGIKPIPRPLNQPTRLSAQRSNGESQDLSGHNGPHSVRSSTRRKRNLLVVKFGGSSLSTARRIGEAAKKVAQECSRGSSLVVVVSAVGKTTDQLMQLTNGETGIAETDRDDILAMGERTSARILAAALKSRGVQVRYFDPSDRDWPIVSDDNFSNANPLVRQSIGKIQRYVRPILDQGIVAVIGGFIGRTGDGRISTLGRGGSDTTAFLLAKGLGANEVVLVTDVDGIMTGDPKLVRDPRRLERIDIELLTGIADSGTKFIHRKALRYKEADMDVRVISSDESNLRARGTIIQGGPIPELEVTLHNPHPVASLAFIGRGLSTKPKLVAGLIGKVRRDLVGTSQDKNAIILYVKQGPGFRNVVEELHSAIKRERGPVAMAARTGLAMISVRGVGLEGTPGVVSRVSEALTSRNINIFGVITIASSVTVFIDWKVRKLGARLIRRSLEDG